MVPIEATELQYQYMHHTGAIRRTKANGVFIVFIDKLCFIAVHSKLLLLQWSLTAFWVRATVNTYMYMHTKLQSSKMIFMNSIIYAGSVCERSVYSCRANW